MRVKSTLRTFAVVAIAAAVVAPTGTSSAAPLSGRPVDVSLSAMRAGLPADISLPPTTPPFTTDPPITTPAITTPAITTDPPTTPPTTPPITTDPPTTTPPTTDPPTTTTAPVPSPDTSTPKPPAGSHNPSSVPGTVASPPKHRTPRPHPHKSLRAPSNTVRQPGIIRPHPHRKPWFITLTIKTAPPLAGVQFTFDGHNVVTDGTGVARYVAPHDFAGHTLTLVKTSVSTPAQRYQFSRWGGQRDPDQAFTKSVKRLPMRADYAVTAAFSLQRQVQPIVVRQDGTAVNPAEVSAITVKSDFGQLMTMSPSSPTWLDVVRPAYHHSVLSAVPVKYSLQSVIVRGTNVVDAGRQAFLPSTSNPRFVTQFYNLTVTAHDALFPTSRGKSIVVTYPDGAAETVPFDAQHRAVLNDLPRGTYKLQIKAGLALVTSTQFTLSRDKSSDLTVISLLDLSVLGGLGLLLALGLIAVGRYLQSRRPADSVQQWTPNAPAYEGASKEQVLT
ncbi:MAG: hypothetical protein QOD87_1186 [Pseudonocardiales bacterium]|nr:hypothetical protein [Pseudonocardiales bacterium]